MHIIELDNFKISNDLPFTLIAGPCQLENRDHALFMAEKLVNITNKLSINLIFKSSFDKANRTSARSQRGIGIESAIRIFSEIKTTFACPVITDVHNEEQSKILADFVDVLQIPAFLCRQTDLLKSAAQTGKIVMVKKGQFLAPWDMKNVAEKLNLFGAKDVMLCERGSCFGYNNLITDLRGLPIMAETGLPVIFDATHSVQQPGGLGAASGGERRFVETLARGALVTKIAGIFAEVHNDPDNAPSDGPCMLKLEDLEPILIRLKSIDNLIKSFEIQT
ncbi:MAG: 3-deoxy-8-phosphooctulonate synthase [Rickettsiaceae bacterium]|nr:3-deoxy-8-phosphooctulonate synthase [Rickettsiaceae bacterium]